jgi:uncharacterized membrane protein YqjE
MATQNRLIDRGDGRTQRALPPATEPAVGDLLKRLGNDSAALVRNEVALAKLEMREMAREVARDSGKLFGAISIALAGVLALLAAGIVALGNALDGNYALSALIVGAVMLIIGGLLARSATKGLKDVQPPTRTVESLRSTGSWARSEIRDFKDEIRS